MGAVVGVGEGVGAAVGVGTVVGRGEGVDVGVAVKVGVAEGVDVGVGSTVAVNSLDSASAEVSSGALESPLQPATSSATPIAKTQQASHLAMFAV